TLASVSDRITASAGCSNGSLTLDGAGGVADLAAGSDDLGGGSDLGPPAVARLIAPLSTATVSSQRPTLRWSLAAGGGTPEVELCKDRGCTMPLGITSTVGAGNDRAVPDSPLAHGWV